MPIAHPIYVVAACDEYKFRATFRFPFHAHWFKPFSVCSRMPNTALHRNSRCPRPFNVTFHLFLLVALHHCRHRLWVSLIR